MVMIFIQVVQEKGKSQMEQLLPTLLCRLRSGKDYVYHNSLNGFFIKWHFEC